MRHALSLVVATDTPSTRPPARDLLVVLDLVQRDSAPDAKGLARVSGTWGVGGDG